MAGKFVVIIKIKTFFCTAPTINKTQTEREIQIDDRYMYVRTYVHMYCMPMC